MSLTPEQRLRQARVKMRLISDREMRKFMRGEIDVLPGNTLERTALDAIRTAYAAGYRDAGTLYRVARALGEPVGSFLPNDDE